MNNKSKILLGILGAAAAGAAIGLLLGPDKGSSLRKQVSKAANDFAGDLTDLWLKNKEKFGDAKDTFLTEARGLKSDAETRYSRVKDSIG